MRNCWLFSTQELLVRGLLLVIHIMLQMQAFLVWLLAIGVKGVFGEASGMVGTSSQSQVITNSTFNPTLMSGNQSNLFFNPTLQHSIFSAKTIDRTAFSGSNWVINTRAIDHMVHFVSCFTSVTAVLNTFVNLPNGETASITYIEIVQILAKLVLYNVLCVPSFTFNLLFVSQLAKSISCCLIFFGTLCFI